MEKLRSKLRKEEWRVPEIRAKRCESMREAAKRRYEDPEERKKAVRRAKQYYIDHPNYREERKEIYAQIAKTLQGRKGRALGLSNSPEYKVWISMNQRCHNSKTTGFENYGGRGIQVCEDWRGPGGFVKFYQYIGARPTPKHTLERINNDGNYEPENVKWATRFEQMKNWRRNRMVTLNGQTKHVAAWARELKVNEQVLNYRLKVGWPFERLSEQPRKKKIGH